MDNKFARANQIDPFGQQVHTSESDRSVRTTSLHELIRSTRSDNKFARENQIDPFGQQVCTSQSDRSVRTTSSHQPIRSAGPTSSHQPIISLQIARTVIEPLIAVTSFEVPKDRTVIEPLIAVTFFEVQEDRLVVGPLYYGHILQSHLQYWTARPSSLSRLRAKAVPCTHKPLTRKAVFNHTQ